MRLRLRPLSAGTLALATLLTSATGAFAQAATDAPTSNAVPLKLDTGDTAWVIVATVLVLAMTPGLAFFYGGLVRTKNAINTLMMSLGAMAVLGLLWALGGYSIAFGNGGAANAWIGGLEFVGLTNFVSKTAHIASPSIPISVHSMFQAMFFLITPALISGALVERIKFTSYLLFISLWGLLVYCPIAHWVWSPGGWIGAQGVMDFAGGTVVHTSAGFSALAAAILLGRRRGYGQVAMNPHSLPLCLLGGSLLWIGWCGFNGGSALHADALGALAVANTILAACAAMFAWMMIDLVMRRAITALGAVTGVVVGLVAVTPASGFVSPLGAILIGIIATGVCYLMVLWRSQGPVDDSLDVFAVHGVGGMTGAILTGVFSTGALARNGLNALALPGLLEGGTDIFWKQTGCIFVVAAFAFVASSFLLKAIDLTLGLRASDEAEYLGLDISQHAEEAYSADEVPTMPVAEGSLA